MKQVLWIYAALIGLSLAFGILSALSFLFGARPGLIAQKLRLGSMIIALNTLLAGCYASSKPAEDAGPKPLRLADTGQRSDTDTRSRTDTATSNDTPTESPTDMPGCYDTDVPLPTDDPPDTPTEIECYDCYDGWESDDGWDAGVETDIPSDTADAGPDSGTDD